MSPKVHIHCTVYMYQYFLSYMHQERGNSMQETLIYIGISSLNQPMSVSPSLHTENPSHIFSLEISSGSDETLLSKSLTPWGQNIIHMKRNLCWKSYNEIKYRPPFTNLPKGTACLIKHKWTCCYYTALQYSVQCTCTIKLKQFNNSMQESVHLWPMTLIPLVDLHLQGKNPTEEK